MEQLQNKKERVTLYRTKNNEITTKFIFMCSTWICRETAWVRILKYSWVPVIISSCATFVADKLTRSLKCSKITSSSSTMSWYSIFFITSQIWPWKKSQYNNAYYFDQGVQRLSTTCEHDVCYFPGRHLDKIKLSLLLWSRHSNCERFIHKRYGISAGTQIIKQ